MAREIPIDHELRSSRYMQCFSFVLNNNGECYITRNGYFGAEYYDRDSAIRRLQEFVEFGFIVVVTVFFTAGDKKEDHYASSEEQRDLIKEQLEGIKISRVIFDVGNKKDKNGGWVSKPEFYYYRDQDKIGFEPRAKIVLEKLRPLELAIGIDTLSNNSRYANL